MEPFKPGDLIHNPMYPDRVFEITKHVKLVNIANTQPFDIYCVKLVSSSFSNDVVGREYNNQTMTGCVIVKRKAKKGHRLTTVFK